jgi:hypothetical protein
MAKEQREVALKLRQSAAEVDAEIVVPDAWKVAEADLKRSQAFWDDEDYEAAAFGFRMAIGKYRDVLQKYEQVAGQRHTIWVAWGMERAEQVKAGPLATETWLAIAEAFHSMGDESGHRTAMGRALASVTAGGLLDPDAGAAAMLTIADIQMRCDDAEGAKAAVKEAVVFSDGIASASSRSIRLAQCAGLFARLGDTDGWNRSLGKAMGAAVQGVRRSDTYLSGRRKSVVQCVAYACAEDAESALPYARGLEEDMRRTLGGSIEAVGTAYGFTSFAAGKRSRSDPNQRQLFERCYVSACVYLMCPPCNHHVNLAMADAVAGASGRAWVGAVGLPDPDSRANVMTLVIRDTCARGHLEMARKMFTYLADADGTPQAASYVAEAEVRFGIRSFATLKRWAEGLPQPADKAAALIGIAAGVKAGVSQRRQDAPQREQIADSTSVAGALNEDAAEMHQDSDPTEAPGELGKVVPKNRSQTRIRDLANKSVASAPFWLLDEAILLAEDVENPCAQASLWLQIAQAQRTTTDEEGYVASIERTKNCCIVQWNKILDRRLPPEKYYDGQYHWRRDRRRLDAESDAITDVLRVLMDLEEVQHENGDTSEAIDTLLLAMKCATELPKETGALAKPAPDDSWSWMTRIAGRLAHYGRTDLAQRLLADGPWFPDRENNLSRKFLLSLAAAETDDVAQLETLAVATKDRADSYNDSQERTYASLVNANLALVAARNGDRERYRRAAMTIGGYVSQQRGPASKTVLLDLAIAATAVGEPDVARQYVEQSGTTGPKRDVALLAIAERLIREGRVGDGRRVIESLQDEICSVRGWYVVSAAEAAAASAELSALLEQADSVSRNSYKAAALAGIGTGLLAK